MIQYKANVVTNPITGTAEEYPALLRGPNSKIWTKDFANNLSRLAQGVGTIIPTGNNKDFFINNHCVPKNKNLTYGHIVD